MQAVLYDLRFALRQLRRSSGFATIVIATIALGIAATTTIFSLVDAVLLRPLPFPEADKLISLQTLERVDSPDNSRGAGVVPNDTSYPNFYDWRSLNKSFSSMAAYQTGGLVFAARSGVSAQRINGAEASAGFFATLGVLPQLGRDFQPADEQAGTRTVVLSYDFWRTNFSADPSIVGRTILLNDAQCTVIGVMPAGFSFPVSNNPAALWLNTGRDAEGSNPSMQQRGYNQLSIVGRLRPGITASQAKADMDTIAQQLAARYPDNNAKETSVSVVPQLQDLVGNVQTPLRILFSAVACLLLIVCANVAGLLLTRTSLRRNEFAIRSAIGASRVTILRQLMMESLTLALAGGFIGLAITSVVLRFLPAFLPANLPRASEISANSEVFLFAIGVSLLTGTLFGVLPAWQASRQDPAQSLGDVARGGFAGRRHFRLQSVLVVTQTAVGLVLLIAAGLLIRSFDRTLRIDPGFDPDQMLSFRISIPTRHMSLEKQGQFIHELLARLQSLQGVKAATAAFPLPLTQGDINISFTIAGRPTPAGEEPSARVSLVELNYFQALRIPLKQGRFFLESENNANGRPVVIVNEAFARRFFPGANPIGQHMTSGLGIGDTPPAREIVGVVGNVKRASPTEADRPEYYIPFEQAPVATPNIALRISGDPSRYYNLVRAEVARMDRTLPVYRFQSYREDLARTTAQQRFQTTLLTAFAFIALALTGLGLYAALSYMVALRTPELGLRMALGAPRASILSLMLSRGLTMVSLGLGAGLFTATALTKTMAGLLYGVKPLDPLTFLGMSLLLIAVSSMASLIPALRAATVDPARTLRNS
ncbi:ABC transporter permease [Acidicapsa dinghuensis]|uniref:ABC transporter permease n=1 Tax=Acidicapsa dinghuensis TaxID=2218256 RepID=A0ABW1ECW1_9BACT|nr:ABC transporter permease [Acidicapsa dinghuensis]